MECAVPSRKGFQSNMGRPPPAHAVHIFIPTTRKFTAPLTQDQAVPCDEDSPDFPSPPDFLDHFDEGNTNDVPGKINNMVMSDSSHSLDPPDDPIIEESTTKLKRPPNPFSSDNELLSDKVTPLVLAGVREKLLKLKLNRELPSEESSLGEFSEADSHSLEAEEYGHGDDSSNSQFSYECAQPRSSEPRPSVLFQNAPGVFISLPRKPSSSGPASSQQSKVGDHVLEPAGEQTQASGPTRRESMSGSVFMSGLSEKYMTGVARKTPSPMPQLVEGKVANVDSFENSSKPSGKDSGSAKNSRTASVSDVSQPQTSGNVFVSLPRSAQTKSGSLQRRFSMSSVSQARSPSMSTFMSIGRSKENLADEGHGASTSSLPRPSFNKSVSQPNGDMMTARARKPRRSASQSNIHGSTQSGFLFVPSGTQPQKVCSLPRGTSMPSFTSMATPRMNTFMSMAKRASDSSVDISQSSTLSRTPTEGKPEEKKSKWKSLDTIFLPKARGLFSSRTPSGTSINEAMPMSFSNDELTERGACKLKRRNSSSVFLAMPPPSNRAESQNPRRQHSVPEIPTGSVRDKEERRRSLPQRRHSLQCGPVTVMSLGWK